MLGIGHRSMQRLISQGLLVPVWKVLPSLKRKSQCFRKAAVEDIVDPEGGFPRRALRVPGPFCASASSPKA